MIKVLNVLLVGCVLFAASVMYALEHETRGLERQNAEIRHKIEATKEDFKLLQAEWSSLTRPERLEEVAIGSLSLAPVTVTQFVPDSGLGAVLQQHRQSMLDLLAQDKGEP